jgi:dynein assembly factor 1
LRFSSAHVAVVVMAGWAMTPNSLRLVCSENGGYAHAPELNDVLHLHRKGICEVSNLEPYLGLKTLYLESNSIDTLDGLRHLAHLRCLYIAKNSLFDLQGVCFLKTLTTLDISENRVGSLEGLRGHPSISVLIAAGNRLKDLQSIEALSMCLALTSLDLMDNNLDDPDVMTWLTNGNELTQEQGVNSSPAGNNTLASRLRLLKFRGNPVVSMTPSYRKKIIAAMGSLNYLDDTPVFHKDRRLAVAFRTGGMDLERVERQAIMEDDRLARERSQRKFEEMVSSSIADAEARKVNGETAPTADPYRFMSHSAAREAKLMQEENVPEWRIEEMRAQETFPWQVREREEKTRERAEATRRQDAETQDAEEALVTETQKAERDAEQVRLEETELLVRAKNLGKHLVGNEVGSVVEEVLGEDVVGVVVSDLEKHAETSARQERESERESEEETEIIPIAIPVDDDGATQDIPFALVADDFETLRVYDPGAFARELELRTVAGAYKDERREARKRELERHAVATSDARGGAVVYGTPSFDILWAQAKALGEAREAEALGDLDDLDDEFDDSGEYSESDSGSGSVDSDADVFERHSVASIGTGTGKA